MEVGGGQLHNIAFLKEETPGVHTICRKSVIPLLVVCRGYFSKVFKIIFKINYA